MVSSALVLRQHHLDIADMNLVHSHLHHVLLFYHGLDAMPIYHLAAIPITNEGERLCLYNARLHTRTHILVFCGDWLYQQ
jgi:hypothetical protein